MVLSADYAAYNGQSHLSICKCTRSFSRNLCNSIPHQYWLHHRVWVEMQSTHLQKQSHMMCWHTLMFVLLTLAPALESCTLLTYHIAPHAVFLVVHILCNTMVVTEYHISSCLQALSKSLQPLLGLPPCWLGACSSLVKATIRVIQVPGNLA